MRCYIAGVQHESSSFSPIPTSLSSFWTVRWGHDRPSVVRGMGYGEACDLAVGLGFEVVAGPFSMAEPSLPASTDAWTAIRDGILAELRAAAPVDIVFLCLHGAQMSDRVDDCEGEILSMARGIVGPTAAIGTLLDLHANVSSQMLDAADLVVSCREYPHIDYGERAVEMLPVLASIARGEVRPRSAAVRIAAPGVYPTPDEPVRSFVRRITEAQQRPGVLMVSANHGFEGSDQPDNAASIVVTVDDDQAAADALAHELAGGLLEMIRSKNWIGPGVVAAVDEALAFVGGPVVLADRADNPGGGAAGDSTYVLAELLARGANDVALALLWDPMAVDLCHDAGLGTRLPLRIGGKAGPLSGAPLDVFAEVTALRTDARQALYGVGEPRLPLGRSAAIRIAGIGTSAAKASIDVVLNSSRQQVFSRHCFTEHGIDPLQRHVVVVKSTQHFMHDFATLAAHVVRCDAPGTMSPDLSTFPYRNVRRPLLGLDPADSIGLEPFPQVAARH
jgi:microcystin degradation protein MlrC